MDNRDWLILKMLAQEKNITKTAESLYISQPALTKRLQQIESEFGTQIVHRGRKGVQFTPQGEHLVKYANDMLSTYMELKDYIQNMQDRVAGTLRIGVSNFITRNKLPKLLKLFKNRFPDVEFKVTSGWSGDIHQLIYDQEVHVAFVRGDYHWEDQKHLLLTEKIYIASLSQMDQKDLPNVPRIDYQADHKLKELIDNWWSTHFAAPPLIGIEVDKSDTCKEMMLNGLGYAILPGLVIEGEKDIFTIPLTDRSGQPIIRETWMLYHEEFMELKLVKAFIEFMKELDFQDTF